MNHKVTVNGKIYTLTRDSFGIVRINELTVDEFLDKLPPEDITWLAKYGMKIVQDEPEMFDDIAERIEMPRDIKSTLDNFKTRKPGKEDV